MSSIFGSRTTQTTTTNPYSGKYAGWLDNAYNILNSKVNTPTSGYSGQINYGPTSGQLSAIANLKGMQDNSFLNKAASGALMNPESNPYAMTTFNAGLDKIMKNFGQARNNVLGSINSNGFMNSSARGNAERMLLDDSNKNAFQYRNDFFGNLYNQGLQATMNAISQQQGLNKDLIGAESLIQGMGQEGLDRQREDYWKAKGFNQQDIQNLISLISLAKNPGQTTESKQHGLFK